MLGFLSHVKLSVEVSPQEIIIFSFYLEKIHFKPTQSLLALIFSDIILVKEGLL